MISKEEYFNALSGRIIRAFGEKLNHLDDKDQDACFRLILMLWESYARREMTDDMMENGQAADGTFEQPKYRNDELDEAYADLLCVLRVLES